MQSINTPTGYKDHESRHNDGPYKQKVYCENIVNLFNLRQLKLYLIIPDFVLSNFI